MLAFFLVAVLVAVIPTAPVGFKTERFEFNGWSALLVELTAEKRFDFLARAAALDAETHMPVMMKDLMLAIDLAAWHLRRWYLPEWLVRRGLRKLPEPLLAELFKACVRLSNIPWRIEPLPDPDPDSGAANELAAVDAEIAADDDWDELADDEKKPTPAQRRGDLSTS